ncbi:MAG TPA: hypothetical protein DD706_22690 [Nitrospiraceae bacterium]|nr:hypothetical protein [Nitrospiraceae bacterium]
MTYLEYARRDISSGTQQGAMNALGHANRAVHLVMDKLLKIYKLDAWAKAPFPVRAELLGDIGAFPTRIVSRLNRARNFMEHDYTFVEVDRAADFVELAELFLTVAYPFFHNGTIGVYVGTKENPLCEEWFLEPQGKGVAVADIKVESYLDLPTMRIPYNIQRPHEVKPRFIVPLTRGSQAEWMPYLDLLVYCTRRRALRLPQPDSRGPGVYLLRHSLEFGMAE